MARLRISSKHVERLAEVAGLNIDPAYLPGVAHNLDILLTQADLLLDPPLDPLVEPAPVFRS